MHNVRMKPEPAAGKESIWLVLQRDLRLWLRDVQEPTYLTLVMDLAAVGTRSAEPGATTGDSLIAALRLAASEPLKGITKGVPDRIQVPIQFAEAMQSVLGDLVREVGFALTLS